MKNPGHIKNKVKRAEVYAKYKGQKKKLKKELRKLREKEVEELGEAAPPKQIPRTIENTRKHDETFVDPDDDEIAGDEKDDEFSKIFSNEVKPKIMLTTRPKCSKKLYEVIQDFMMLIPNTFYYPRGDTLLKDLCKHAGDKGFTHLMILGERLKQCNGLLVAQLPDGPTAYFKLSSYEPASKIPGRGSPTSHIPELILNNFSTRFGRRVGRLLGAFFPHEPQLEGRQVVTFHNQRDFIFVRHHRYIYRKEKDQVKAKLQELGPRFTLKLKYLLDGCMDTQFGDYEYVQKAGVKGAGGKKTFVL
eukprot:gene28708-34656_t